MGGQTFYDTLGVPDGASPTAVKRRVRERLEEYQRDITEADDPETEARVYQLAYEVLTDPKERHLYDLYGHDRYVDERLEVDEATLESAALDADVTPVFTGGDGSGDTRVFDPTADDGETNVFDGTAGGVTAVQDEGAAGADTAVEGAGDANTAIERPGDAAGADTAVEEGPDARETTSSAGGDAGGTDADDGDTLIQEEAPEAALESVTEEETMVQQLAVYEPWASPLADLPGMDADPPLRYAALGGYAVGGLAVLALLGLLLPYGSATLAWLTVLVFLVGVVATVAVGALVYERDVVYRSAGGAGACLPAVALVGFAVDPPLVTLLGGAAVGLAGVAAGDAYLAATRRRLREGRKGDESRGGNAYLETDGDAGTEDDAIDGEALVDGVSRQETVPEDLEDEVVVRGTREIVPERHIRRELTVEDTQTPRELPPGEFASFRDGTREDVHDRDQHHPGGFEDMTTTYLIAASVEEITCPDCRGSTRVTCPNCNGGGVESCPNCGGSGRETCSSCRGSGTDSDGDRCRSCGGSGSHPCGRCNRTGTITCRRCNGGGDVPCDRCNATGTVVTFTTLTREYRASETVQYETRSVPKQFLTAPEGVRVQRDRDRNGDPDAASGDWFMREHEIREIPTDVATYEYAGDLYEAYEIEGEVQAPDAPRNLATATRNAGIAAGACLVVYLYLGILGPAGLP
jgi:hypothetical protein